MVQNIYFGFKLLKMSLVAKLFKQNKSVEPVQKRWFLHHRPPFVEVRANDGHTYRIMSDLKTSVLIGTHALPAPACPFPALGLLTNLYLVLYRMRKQIAYTVAGLILLFVAATATAVYLLSAHPAMGEMLQNALISALLLLISVSTAAYGSYIIYLFLRSSENVFREIVADVKEQKQLGAGAETMPGDYDISPDILMMQGADETHADFVNRLEEAKSSAGHGIWVLALAWRTPVGTIWQTPTKSMLFARNAPPFQNETWTDEQRICPANAVFDTETHAEFDAYVQDFVFYYRKWAPINKATSDDRAEAGRNWLESVRARTTAACVAILLCASGIAAQSAKAVADALGKNNVVPELHADVSYQFEKKTLGRVGNGKSDYVQLLKNIPAYRDCCHGALIAVYKNGDLVAKGSAAGEVAAKPAEQMRERGTSAIAPETVPGFTLADIPDSSGMATMAEKAKRQIDQIGTIAGQSIRPWWEVVMHGLWTAFPFLLIAGAIAWLFAGVCAREGMYDLHKQSRRALAVIALAVAAVLLVNFLLIAVGMGFGPLGLSIIAAIETYIAYRLVTWLVPDFTPAAGNEPERGMFRRGGNFPQLGP